MRYEPRSLCPSTLQTIFNSAQERSVVANILVCREISPRFKSKNLILCWHYWFMPFRISWRMFGGRNLVLAFPLKGNPVMWASFGKMQCRHPAASSVCFDIGVVSFLNQRSSLKIFQLSLHGSCLFPEATWGSLDTVYRKVFPYVRQLYINVPLEVRLRPIHPFSTVLYNYASSSDTLCAIR